MSRFGELLDAGEFVDARVCGDCISFLAYGNGFEMSPAQRVAVRKNLGVYDVTLGHTHKGEWSNCWHKDEPCEDDCDCERTDFSWRSCDLCESGLGGYRHDAIMVKWSDLEEPVKASQDRKQRVRKLLGKD